MICWWARENEEGKKRFIRISGDLYVFLIMKKHPSWLRGARI
jgi:hypothetical protein